MKREYELALSDLSRAGWDVHRSHADVRLPGDVLARYAWLPEDLLSFVAETERAVNPEQTAWLLTHSDYCGTGDSEFAWNQWEQDTLDAARGDGDWSARIRLFCDDHFPVLLSVKSGYAYFVLRKSELSVVCGEEPEYDSSSMRGRTFMAKACRVAAFERNEFRSTTTE